MTWLWVLPVLLVSALIFVFYPIFTRAGARTLSEGIEEEVRSHLIHRRDNLLRQIKELEYDEAEQRLDRSNALAIRNTLEQELGAVFQELDAKHDALLENHSTTRQRPTTGSTASVLTAISIMALIAIATSGLYAWIGNPMGKPPLQTAAPSHNEAPPLDEIIMRLAKQMKENPQDIEAAIQLAELEIRSGDPELIELGFRLFERILEQDPNRAEALWFTGVNAYRKNDKKRALKQWQHLLSQLPEEGNDPLRAMVNKAIADAKLP